MPRVKVNCLAVRERDRGDRVAPWKHNSFFYYWFDLRVSHYNSSIVKKVQEVLVIRSSAIRPPSTRYVNLARSVQCLRRSHIVFLRIFDFCWSHVIKIILGKVQVGSDRRKSWCPEWKLIVWPSMNGIAAIELLHENTISLFITESNWVCLTIIGLLWKKLKK